MSHRLFLALVLSGLPSGGLAERAQCPPGQICVNAAAVQPGTRPLSERETESHVFFPLGGAALGEGALSQLDRMAQVLGTSLLRDACIKLEGHADATGSEDLNRSLSVARAEAVANYLRPRLDRADRVVAVTGEGSSRPLDGLPASAAENRRVAVLARRCAS